MVPVGRRLRRWKHGRRVSSLVREGQCGSCRLKAGERNSSIATLRHQTSNGELRPRLMHSVPVFPKLFPLQLARAFHWRTNLLRGPLAVADVVPNVLLRDARIRCSRSPFGVGVDVRRADTAGLSRSAMRP